MNVLRVLLAVIHVLIPALSIGLFSLIQNHTFELATGLEKEAQEVVMMKWFNYELMALFVLPPLVSWICLWLFEWFSDVRKHGTFRFYWSRKLLISFGTWSPFVMTFLIWGVASSIDMALAMISIVVIVPAHIFYGVLVWLALPEYSTKVRSKITSQSPAIEGPSMYSPP